MFAQLKGVYGEPSASFTAVIRLAKQFRLGWQSTLEEVSPGSPIAVSSDRDVAAGSKLVTKTLRLKVNKIAFEPGLQTKTVNRVLYVKLGLSKVYAKCGPKPLTPEH